MAPPSKLAVATSSVLRLVKEEASYHKEIEQQEARIKKLEKSLEEGNAEDNAEFQLNQDRQALEETRTVLLTFEKNILEALEKLNAELESHKDASGEVSTEEFTNAKDAVEKATKVAKVDQGVL
jgi:tubulin-specific chaperone A